MSASTSAPSESASANTALNLSSLSQSLSADQLRELVRLHVASRQSGCAIACPAGGIGSNSEEWLIDSATTDHIAGPSGAHRVLPSSIESASIALGTANGPTFIDQTGTANVPNVGVLESNLIAGDSPNLASMGRLIINDLNKFVWIRNSYHPIMSQDEKLAKRLELAVRDTQHVMPIVVKNFVPTVVAIAIANSYFVCNSFTKQICCYRRRPHMQVVQMRNQLLHQQVS